jgi:hypothetical protein
VSIEIAPNGQTPGTFARGGDTLVTVVEDHQFHTVDLVAIHHYEVPVQERGTNVS